MEDEVVADGERAVEVAPLRHDRNLLPRPHRISHDVDTPDSRDPAGGPDACRQHADRRRLPRAVGAEQAEHLPGGDAEGDAVDGVHRRLRIPLDETDDLDGGGCGVLGEHVEIVGPADLTMLS